jgi:hypothetical protein
MVGEWGIRHLPRCTHHVFLSHCAEDRRRLVLPVFHCLEREHRLPWIDLHHYPIGQGPFEALREGIIRCRHVVCFVTERFLAQGRGWNSVENTYANLLQENLHFRSQETCHIQLPLFFLPRGDLTLRRSAWGPFINRGRFYAGAGIRKRAVQWATRQIIEFVRQEETGGACLIEQLRSDPGFKLWASEEPNLRRRIMCADPPPGP